jgi:hypothetical protein
MRVQRREAKLLSRKRAGARRRESRKNMMSHAGLGDHGSGAEKTSSGSRSGCSADARRSTSSPGRVDRDAAATAACDRGSDSLYDKLFGEDGSCQSVRMAMSLGGSVSAGYTAGNRIGIVL